MNLLKRNYNGNMSFWDIRSRTFHISPIPTIPTNRVDIFKFTSVAISDIVRIGHDTP